MQNTKRLEKIFYQSKSLYPNNLVIDSGYICVPFHGKNIQIISELCCYSDLLWDNIDIASHVLSQVSSVLYEYLDNEKKGLFYVTCFQVFDANIQRKILLQIKSRYLHHLYINERGCLCVRYREKMVEIFNPDCCNIELLEKIDVVAYILAQISITLYKYLDKEGF